MDAKTGHFVGHHKGGEGKGVDRRRLTLSEKITALTPTITEKDAMVMIVSYCESTCYEFISNFVYTF